MIEGNIYLPFRWDTHYNFISHIICRKKLYLKWWLANVWTVPHLKTLSERATIDFIRDKITCFKINRSTSCVCQN